MPVGQQDVAALNKFRRPFLRPLHAIRFGALYEVIPLIRTPHAAHPAPAIAHADDVLVFVVCGIAVAGMAHVLGVATEQAGEAAGPRVSALLNATFGNAPELIIALLAVHAGLTEVVRGSLTGSVVSNILLVLGASLVAGGRGSLDRFSSFLAFGLVLAATALFLIPSIPGWDGDPDTRSLAVVSAVISTDRTYLNVTAPLIPGTRSGSG